MTFINRLSEETGSTALHAACDVESQRKAFLLLQAGAQLKADGKGEQPKVENLFKRSLLVFTPSQEELHQMTNYEEALFSQLISLFGAGGWPLGIQHVVENPHLVELLRSWEAMDAATKEEAERRVLKAFGKNIKMISGPPLPTSMGGADREGMEELFQRWNSNHSMKCEYPGVILYE